jgi:AcrR family transcriptional regulator
MSDPSSPAEPASPSRPTWRRKFRYHHGDLEASALRCGRELVAQGGPNALTMRGLARELGVSATALAHLYRSVDVMRSAVARSVLEELEAATLNVETGRSTPREAAEAWIEFAAANANLYRLVSGEGWHAFARRPTGHHGVLAVLSPRKVLEFGLAKRCRKDKRPMARAAAVTVHGLALARIDGVPAEEVAEALDAAVGTLR